MKDAIDQLIAAFDPHACQAVSRQADQSLVFTVNDKAHGASVTKVIPLRALDCQTTLSTVIKDIQRPRPQHRPSQPGLRPGSADPRTTDSALSRLIKRLLIPNSWCLQSNRPTA